MGEELLGAVIPMMMLKKEMYEFVEGLVKENIKERREKKLLTIEEASIFLNVKVSRLRQAVFRREINYVKLGALVRFREDDLEKFITKNLKSFTQS